MEISRIYWALGIVLAVLSVAWFALPASELQGAMAPTSSASSALLTPSAEKVRPPAAVAGNRETASSNAGTTKWPVNADEVERFSRWYIERGAAGEARLLPDGTMTGNEIFTEYPVMDEAGLATLAKLGDPRAAAELGTRLADRYLENRERRNPEDLARAKQLLSDATMRGFTTSLARLFELQLDIAENAGVQSRPGQPRVDRVALLEAYQYLYLCERRGELSIDAYRAMSNAVGKLSDAEDQEARSRAASLYDAMTEQRLQLGMPRFTDGIPKDIADIVDRLTGHAMSQRSSEAQDGQ